ncbi:MAG TPA: hypothetical protein VL099_11930 [Candidatus Binatia bacterium]|nr:hypothetical protein [Candidatus Binatia bacterium]
MTKRLRFGLLVCGTASLLPVLPAARSVVAKHSASVEAARGAIPVEEVRKQRIQHTARFATTAAYFDGVFQGQLTASQYMDRRAPLGRWSAPADRDAFATGYLDGYAELLATKNQPVPEP